jgi:hypothetical protein
MHWLEQEQATPLESAVDDRGRDVLIVENPIPGCG